MDKIQINTPVLVLVGPTAVGKTALSLHIAKNYGFEIISMDSMQVYRYMDIGTAKVSEEEQKAIPHHLIDIVDPDQDYDVARFRLDALAAIKKIENRGCKPLITGGTGLYLQALLEGLFADIPTSDSIKKTLKKRLEKEGSEELHKEFRQCDPLAAARIHPNDTQRILRGLEIFYASGIPWSEHLRKQTEAKKNTEMQFHNILQVGLTCPRDVLYERINLRSKIMLQQGLENEVQDLLAKGYSSTLKSMCSIGYRHVNEHLAGLYDREEMLRLLARDTRRYAKRQYTWFNKSKEILWMDVNNHSKICDEIETWLAKI